MDMMREMLARQKYEALEKKLQSLTPEEAAAQIILFMQEIPDYPQAHNDLAVLLHKQGELLQALGRFERAVRLAPDNRTFRKNLAGFYFVELGWTDDAILMYTDLLKDGPEDTEVLGALALISNRIGRPDEAGHFLRKILDIEPWNQEARSLLNSMMPSDVAVPKVIPVVSSPSAPAPEDIDSLLADLRQSVAELSKSHVQVSTHERSNAEANCRTKIAELEDRLRNDPTNALTNNDLGVLYLGVGNLERSCDHHELAFRYAPQNLIFRKNLAGVCSVIDGKMDRAIELLTGGLREYPTDTEILGALAQISVRLGRNDEALIFVRRILSLEPWNQDAGSLLTQLQQTMEGSFFLNR